MKFHKSLRKTTKSFVASMAAVGSVLLLSNLITHPARAQDETTKRDFNNDGASDILWHHSTNRQVSIWFMNGAAISSTPIVGTVTDPHWQVVGTSQN